METQPKLEIERRFLLKGLPNEISLDDFDDTIRIWQYYLPNGVRLRYQSSNINGSKYFHTEKTPTDNPMVDIELDYEISELEYHETYNNANGNVKSIWKTRYIKYVGDLKYEIDVFHYQTLTIVEVELPSVDYPLTLPDFIQKNLLLEVTEMRQFKNINLAS